MTRSYPVRITQMSDMEKMNRIIDLENALQQTNDRIAAAVQAEREAVAKSLPLTIKTAIETEREACAKVAEDQALAESSLVSCNPCYRIAAAIRARNGAGRK